MNVNVTAPKSARVRPDFVPTDAYISKDYLQLEKERLWPRVWQMACREEEIPRPGDFYTYDIADEFDSGRPTQRRRHRGLLQCVPASRTSAHVGLWANGKIPLQISWLAMDSRGQAS